VEVVGIDEAQFFDDGLPDVCEQLANRGIRVIIAGLDMDFLGQTIRTHSGITGKSRIHHQSACYLCAMRCAGKSFLPFGGK
jgi:thymidine kinase